MKANAGKQCNHGKCVVFPWRGVANNFDPVEIKDIFSISEFDQMV